MKCEHVIPTAIDKLVDEEKISVKVLKSKDKWFGVTYREDKPGVCEALAKKKESGEYPNRLWR